MEIKKITNLLIRLVRTSIVESRTRSIHHLLPSHHTRQRIPRSIISLPRHRNRQLKKALHLHIHNRFQNSNFHPIFHPHPFMTLDIQGDAQFSKTFHAGKAGPDRIPHLSLEPYTFLWVWIRGAGFGYILAEYWKRGIAWNCPDEPERAGGIYPIPRKKTRQELDVVCNVGRKVVASVEVVGCFWVSVFLWVILIVQVGMNWSTLTSDDRWEIAR